MNQSLIYSTENGNIYLYDNQSRLSILMHPEFENAFENSPKADPYYLKKYAYLKNHGFFANIAHTDFIPLEESIVRENIINAKQIVFEVTDSCNLKCTYCALGELYDAVDERIGKKINTQYATNLLKYIFNLKPKCENSQLIIGFYGGEALLNINFIKHIVEVASQLNTNRKMELVYSMTTNATLIDKHIDFLAANKFRLLISLDGNEYNHSYRVFEKSKNNSFQKVIRNVDTIQQDYPEYFLNYVNFNAVLHDRNSVKDIYQFIYNRYHKIPRISELNMRDIKDDKKDVLKNMFNSLRKSEAAFQEVYSDLAQLTHSELSSYKELTYFLKYLSVNYYISNINALLHNVEKQLPTSTCTPFSKKIFMTNRNKLLPCERVNYKYSLGKMNENIDVDISDITFKYNYYYSRFVKYCEKCYLYRFCGICLFQENNIDNIGDGDFVCNGFHGLEAFKNKLHNIYTFLEKYPKDFFNILENTILE